MTTNTSFTWGVAYAGSTFDLRSAGNEMAVVCPPYTGAAAAQLRGFSLAAGDTLDVQPILQTANVPVTAAELGAYFSTTENNGSTLLWFNAAGTGAVPGNGATVVAVLENTQLSMSQLVSAMNVGAPITPTAVQSLMHMGCTNNVITYRLEGLETVCLQSGGNGSACGLQVTGLGLASKVRFLVLPARSQRRSCREAKVDSGCLTGRWMGRQA